MIPLSTVRAAEPWSPGSVLAGIVLAFVVVALIVWGVTRGPR